MSSSHLLNGHLVLSGVVTAEQEARCNEAIDQHADQLVPHARQFEGDSHALTSAVRQHWLSGMLSWEASLLRALSRASRRLRPYLKEILGSSEGRGGRARVAIG